MRMVPVLSSGDAARHKGGNFPFGHDAKETGTLVFLRVSKYLFSREFLGN